MMRFPLLYVEGRNDLYSLQALLEKHGLMITEKYGPIRFEPTDSVSSMLDGIGTFVKAAQNRGEPIGFVLDIDTDLSSRWHNIRSKLKNIGLDINDDALTDDGLIIETPRGKIGFWLMPDNCVRSGKLEDFLRTLIDENDPILNKSLEYVDSVKSNVDCSSRFRDIDIEKAEMSAWLAVKNPPGQPYGTAIKASILKAHSPVADKFVAWVKNLYGIL